MSPLNDTPSPADAAAEVNSLTAGLGIILTSFAPFALPGLLLALPFVLPLVPLLLVGGILYLVVRAILVPVRLARRAWRARTGSAERAGHDARRDAIVERAHG